MATVTFFIHPTTALKKVLIPYPDHAWGKPQLWEMEQHHSNPRGLQFDIEILAKALYLVEIARIEQPDPFTENLRDTLFGKPPRYNISLCEKWWTLEKCGVGELFGITLNQTQPEHFAVIEKTTYDVIDDWLEQVSTQQHNPKLQISLAGITDYIRYPTAALLELTKARPNNLWIHKALWRLPSHIIAQQEQYNLVLLKVLYLLELVRRGNPYGTKRSWMKIMFGEPPRYNINNFDKWWTIQPTKCVGGFLQIIESILHDEALQRAFRRIELTGHEGTDNWLRRMGTGLN